MPTSTENQDNSAQIAYWNDRAGVTWTAFQERLDALFEPLTALAVEAAAPQPGEHVIDVGCGCGASVLALAKRLGATGEVMGLDVSEPMSARARERIAASGLTNARVVVSDAATHDFRDAGSDLLFSRFGVMFFADPAAAFANLRGAIRPGGRLLCVVWRQLADNPWFTVPLEAARSLLAPQPPSDPHAPGPFAFADPDRTLGVLAKAGWKNAALRRHDVPIRLAAAGQLEQAVEFATRVGILARMLAEEENPETRARVRLAVGEALKPYEGPTGINLSGSIWLVSANA
jgi:SAM-dependent methyltransferase